MSVKSERRAWYAANVEAKPVGVALDSAEYMAWVKKANAHMRTLCVSGTADLKPGVADAEVAALPVSTAGESDYTIAAVADRSAPVVIAEVKHIDIAPVASIAPKRERKPKVAPVKRARVKTTPLKVPARVAVNAIVSVADVLPVDMRGGGHADVALDARYLVLAAHPERGSWWLQRFDNPTGTSADMFGVRGSALKVAGNGVAAASFAAQSLEIAA